jgi:hypothetical protein
MVEGVIRGLIILCVLVAAVFIVLWVIGQLGLAIPSMVVTIIWIIVALIALLILWRIVSPYVNL